MNPLITDSLKAVETSTTFDENENLISAVDRVFAEAGHPNPTAWQVYLDPLAREYEDKIVLRVAINRALRLVFTNLPSDISSTEARFCLIDVGAFSDWLRLIRTGVIPLMVKHSLLF